MKIPVEWLRDIVDTPLSDEALADRLTMAGLEVEETCPSDDGPVFHTKVTPNRGDWLSVVGVAREAAAALEVPFSWQPARLPDEDQDIRRWAGVLVSDPLLCPRYAGKVIRNVAHRPTPGWMQKRLLAAGMRPIDIVVDITNYVMLELGQPLHAFNYDALPEGKIVVRPTRAGESIITLDGMERSLPEGALAICDIEKPVCIAGIMGNAETEVDAGTRNIFLEAAHFNWLSIRRTSKLLGLATEASYRFERTVDPNLVPIALERAAELLADLADGEVVLGRIDLYPQPAPPRIITLRPARVNAILGTNLAHDIMARSLNRLGFLVAEPLAKTTGRQTSEADDSFLVTTPSFRPDIVKEIDLIEEVGRMVGYDNLPETLPSTPGTGAADAAPGLFATKLRNILSGLGMYEVQSHVMVAPSAFDDPEILNQRVVLRQALSSELSGLRISLVPNLLDIAALNLRRRQPDVRIFEVGKVFRRAEPEETVEPLSLLDIAPSVVCYQEPLRLAAVVTGREGIRGWDDADSKPVTFYSAKGIVEILLSLLGLPTAEFAPLALSGMHSGRSAGVSINGLPIGIVAEVDPDSVKNHLDVPASVGRIALFELDVDALLNLATDDRRYRPLPKYPSISRDLAVVVEKSTAYAAISESARAAADSSLLEELSVQSVYTGEHVPPGSKSVAIRLVFRAPDRTLTDPEVDAQIVAVERALAYQLGAERR